MALCPSVVGRGGSRPATVVPHGAATYRTPKFSRKCHNNSKKKKERGRGRELGGGGEGAKFCRFFVSLEVKKYSDT
jgi:hypothetical protein